MKKTVCTVLALVMLVMSIVPVCAVKKSAGLSEDKIIEIVGALGIMQGDTYGNLNLENRVTRAEFIKMAVCASAYKDDADVKIAYSLFPDLPADHWAAGFVRAGVSAGWINGYLDGTFRPSGFVKLEEAATIVLKMLGYKDADFLGSYPNGQLAKYRSLELSTGISAQSGTELTRRECMYLIYNTLCTYTKNGTAYSKSLGYECDAYGNIDYSMLVSEKRKGPFVVTDTAAWKENLSLPANITVYKDGKRIQEQDIKQYDVVYYSPEFSSVWVYSDKTAGIIEGFSPDINSPTSVTVSGKEYQLAPRDQYAGNLSSGSFPVDSSIVLLLGENGEAVEAFLCDKAFTADKNTSFSDYASTFYLNDARVENVKVSSKSLVYVCPELSSAFVYDRNVSGIVSALSPSEQKPDSVTVGGNNYPLASNTKSLFENGKVFGKDDFVTLYLGSQGVIEYAEKADIYDTDIYKDNGLSYDALVEQTLDGPVVVKGESWKSSLGFDISDAVFYCDGREVEISVIRDYDVVYYSPTFKNVWIYSDKVTGTVESVLPNTVTPSSVVVAGSEYKIESSDVSIAFGGKGKFAVGDTVTLIMGRNGVVSVEKPEITSGIVLGISTDVSKKEYKGSDGKLYTDYYITVSAFDGRTHSIKTGDKNFSTGVPVIVSFSDGNLYVKQIAHQYPEISNLKAAIREGKIAPDAVIVDCYGRSFIKTHASRLSEVTLIPEKVIYYNINKDGYVDYLVLDDVTGDMHSYGVIMLDNGKASFITSAQNSSLSNVTSPSIGVVRVKYDNDEANSIRVLASVDVSAVLESSVSLGGLSYKLWDGCECFVMEQSSFVIKKDSDSVLSEVITKTSLEYIRSLLTGNDYVIKAYYDEDKMVRVLVAQRKY